MSDEHLIMVRVTRGPTGQRLTYMDMAGKKQNTA